MNDAECYQKNRTDLVACGNCVRITCDRFRMERLKVAHIVLFQVGMEFSAAVSASNENNIEDFPDFLVVCFTANKINKLVIKTSTTPRLGKCIILL